MKRIILSILAIIITTDAFACCFFYGIRDRNAENWHLAQMYEDPSYCRNIKKKDDRNTCLAIVKNDKSYCFAVYDKNSKKACNARFES
ncbi:MAG: hypothetical protein LBK26_02435 [Rickettsiales bacterium]|nr:hypothetical protein [Rickettsiales bacterium]